VILIFTPDLFTQLAADRATAVFPASWPVFSGHFPNRPIVPAYALVGLVLAHGESSLGPLTLASVERMKLARAVGPGEPVTSELLLERREAGVKLRSRLSSPAGVVGSLVLSARVGA
jgi:3-hydroxymyristoyl/3-hydroxydecanoyl-(acyl carrier protein) dehydratase